MKNFLPQVVNTEGYITVDRYLKVVDQESVPDNVYAVGDVSFSATSFKTLF